MANRNLAFRLQYHISLDYLKRRLKYVFDINILQLIDRSKHLYKLMHFQKENVGVFPDQTIQTKSVFMLEILIHLQRITMNNYIYLKVISISRTFYEFYWEPYAAFHGMTLLCHIEGSKISVVWTHPWMFFFLPIPRVKNWILLKPVLGGVDGSLLLTVPSMSRLKQTEPATFSILPCWSFLRVAAFLYFNHCIKW
jgi:hypothetical protein